MRLLVYRAVARARAGGGAYTSRCDGSSRGECAGSDWRFGVPAITNVPKRFQLIAAVLKKPTQACFVVRDHTVRTVERRADRVGGNGADRTRAAALRTARVTRRGEGAVASLDRLRRCRTISAARAASALVTMPSRCRRGARSQYPYQ
jgi:hypothetical protein